MYSLDGKRKNSIFLFDNSQSNYSGFFDNEETENSASIDIDLVANLNEAIKIQKEQAEKSEMEDHLKFMDNLLKEIL